MNKRPIKPLKVVTWYDGKEIEASKRWLTREADDALKKFTAILFGQYRENSGNISLSKTADLVRTLGIPYSQYDVHNALLVLSQFSYFENSTSLGSAVKMVTIEQSVTTRPIAEYENPSIDKTTITCRVVLAPIKRHFTLPDISWTDPWEALKQIELKIDGFYHSISGFVIRKQE